jgi:hypothetical protein
MAPGEALVLAANKALQNADVRASIRDMHAQKYPLIRMVEALGLEDDLTKEIRKALEDLPPNVVEGIRQATLQMLDDPSEQYTMPLDCDVSNDQLGSGISAHLETDPVNGRLTIAINSRASV